MAFFYAMTEERRLKYSEDWIKRLEEQWGGDIKQQREDSIKFCNAEATITKVIAGRAQLTTTDMQDAIDLAKPDILETIAGIDEPMKLDPTKKYRTKDVKALEQITNIHIRRKNPWYLICDGFLDNSMKLIVGFIKYQFISDQVTRKINIENISDAHLDRKLQEPGASLKSDEFDEQTGERKTVIAYTRKEEKIVLRNVPSECVRFPIDTEFIADSPFVVEEVLLYPHQFAQTYGEEHLKAVKKLKREFQKSNLLQDRWKHLGGLKFLYDSKLEKYKAYECYFFDQDTFEPVMFVFSGTHVIINEENKYGKPPYEGGSPFLLANLLIGKGYIHYLREIQSKRTVLDRQIFDNLIQANFRRYFGMPEFINMDDYLNNNSTNAFIRVTAKPSEILQAEEKAPLPPEVFTYREALLMEKDMHIPTPRVFQGVDNPKGEKTYRGRQIKTMQAGKKLAMMIRGYMEAVFAPLFQDVIYCITNFMSDETIAKYFDEDERPNFEGIEEHYDLIVKAGLGTQDKVDLIAKLQQLLGLAWQGMASGSKAVTDQNIYVIFREIVRTMGFLNTQDFVTDPMLTEKIITLMQTVAQLMERLSQIPGLQAELQAVVPQIMQLTQEITQGLGLAVPKQGGANEMGSAPGEEAAAIPEQPVQARQPVLTGDGGGFFG